MMNDSDKPALGLDLDGTIDEAADFFQVLSHNWPGKVYIITYRDDAEKATRDVERFGVRYDEIILVSSFEQKAVEIERLGIAVYFDDQDEMLQHVAEGVTVFKIRNGGNFDFEASKWLFSDRTGKLL